MRVGTCILQIVCCVPSLNVDSLHCLTYCCQKVLYKILCMCFETFISLRYRTPQNEIVSDHLIGELVEKYPLKSVKSKVLCTLNCAVCIPYH